MTRIANRYAVMAALVALLLALPVQASVNKSITIAAGESADGATTVNGKVTVGAGATVLAGLLAPAPEQRYPTAAQIVEDLARVRREQSPRGPGLARVGSGLAPITARQNELANIVQRVNVGQPNGAFLVVRGPGGSLA